MRPTILPRHFLFSVALLLVLICVYVFFEARRLQGELLAQTEAKGAALAEAMAANIRAAVMANGLLDDLIGQKLLDNARLIDDLLQFPPVDRKWLQRIAAANRLQKIELLDPSGRPFDGPPVTDRQRMREMMTQMGKSETPDGSEHHSAIMTFMWGRRWRFGPTPPPPSKIADKKFWQGSVFGVAIGARSFAGIIAVHANADYILNFRKDIDVQKQVEELAGQPGVDHVVLVDNNQKILAHAERPGIVRRRDDASPFDLKTIPGPGSRIVERGGGSRHYDVVKALSINGAPLGLLEIGLSLQPMEDTWRRGLRSMVVFGFAILAVGSLGMGAIFYNQKSHMKKIAALQDELARKERLSELGNLAATVAHEIRNPLNSVSMGMQRLKAEFTPTQDSEEYAHFLDLMQGEVHRLNAIVEQFLSLARPLNLRHERIEIAEFLREATTLLEGDARTSQIRIERKVAPDLPPLQADRNYLKQLLLNLILNGIQAMPQGGTLSIEAGVEQEFLRLRVSDRGVGIAPDKLTRIFEPYFTTKTNGSGLGLAIARRIVEAHGGKISVVSQPAKGSCFQVLLPLGSTKV